eukprot:6983264-Pyramimonas_sp.AAC.1
MQGVSWHGPPLYDPRASGFACGRGGEGRSADQVLSKDRPSWHSYRPTATCYRNPTKCYGNENKVLRTSPMCPNWTNSTRQVLRTFRADHRRLLLTFFGGPMPAVDKPPLSKPPL